METVHFGVQHVVDYKLLHLLATQKRDDFESMFHYSYKFGVLVADGDKSIQEMVDERAEDAQRGITVVLPLIEENSICKVSTVVPQIVEDVVVTFPVKGKTLESSSSLLYVAGSEELCMQEMLCVSGVNEIDTTLSVVVPGFDAIFDLGAYTFSDMRVERKFDFLGVTSFETLDEFSSEMCSVQVVEREWSILVTYTLSSSNYHQYVMCRKIIGDTVISNQLKRRYDKFDKKVREFFRILYNQLSKLERTELVAHNMSALSMYRIPMSMPSGELINQSLYMVGRKSQCSDWYHSFEECWQLQLVESDWTEIVDYVINGAAIHRSVMDYVQRGVRGQSRLDISPFLERSYPEWARYKPYMLSGHATYGQFLNMCRGVGFDRLLSLEEQEIMLKRVRKIKAWNCKNRPCPYKDGYCH